MRRNSLFKSQIQSIQLELHQSRLFIGHLWLNTFLRLHICKLEGSHKGLKENPHQNSNTLEGGVANFQDGLCRLEERLQIVLSICLKIEAIASSTKIASTQINFQEKAVETTIITPTR